MKRIFIPPLTLLFLGLLFHFGRQPGPSQQTLSDDSLLKEASAHPPLPKSQADSRLPQGQLPDEQSKESPPEKTKEALSTLTSGEQKSLAKALSEARREVRPIPKSRAMRDENVGYDFYALHPKQNLTTRFGSEGVQIVSSDRTYTEKDSKNPTTAWQAQVRLLSFAGEQVFQNPVPKKSDQSSSLIEYLHRPDLIEWYNNGVDGMEHGYTIKTRPSNLGEGEEILLDIALDGLQVKTQDDQTLIFVHDEREVLEYSKLIVLDAKGKTLPARMKTSENGFSIAYNDTHATYPVTVDPLFINLEAKLNRLPQAYGDRFGNSVAISGETAVIGVPNDDDAGVNSGSTYLFAKNGNNWEFQSKLTANDGSANDSFGNSVAISNNSVVIGAPFDSDVVFNSGSAYVFINNGGAWTQQAKLTANDAGATDIFGLSVAISNDTVVVGAPQNSDAGVSSGSAYVFVRNDNAWSQQAKLIAVDAATEDQFGSSVSISSDSIVVGSLYDDHAGTNSGSAYVYVRTGSSWSQQAKLIGGDVAADSRFGRSLSILHDTIVVGASLDDDGGTNSGSAYVFVRNGISWSEQAKLTANDAAADDAFGISVSISNDTIIVGGSLTDDDGTNSGSAYLFERIGGVWSEALKITADDAEAEDRFGASVAISGDTIIIGAAYDDYDGVTNSGSSYLFERDGESWVQEAKLTAGVIAGDSESEDWFGISLAIAGDTVIVGASHDDDGGTSSGSAYIFTRNNKVWEQQAKLTSLDASSGDLFGVSTAISGNTAVIGAVYDDDDGISSGSAYVFTRTGNIWSQQAKLKANDAAAEDYFGEELAISGDSVVIGARFNDDKGNNSGSAYIFVRTGTTWLQQAKLIANDAEADDTFGESLAISNDTVVIGAALDDDDGQGSGSAYIFVRSGITWSQQAKLTASDASANDQFGRAVAISGDTVIVGAWRDDTGGLIDSGSAYVFTRSGTSWSQQAKLTADDAANSDWFGIPVAISDNTIIVGAQADDIGSITNAGSAYVFKRNGPSWSQESKLVAFDGQAGDIFGISLAISGNTVVAGAFMDDDGGMDTGSVYIYRLAQSATSIVLAYNHLGSEISNASSGATLPGQLLDTTQNFTFHLGNGGYLDLDIQSVSLGGTHAAQFGLILPDISSTSDLLFDESLDYTISFTPTGNSGIRNAVIFITSNDPVTPIFTFNVSGLGLSATTDGDGDGMNDWGEYTMRVFGFEWENPQPNLVSDYYTHAHTTGLYTQEQVVGVTGNWSFFNADPVNNTVDLVISLQQSLDLSSFNQLALDPSKLSIDVNGNILYQLETTPDKKFVRAGWLGQ